MLESTDADFHGREGPIQRLGTPTTKVKSVKQKTLHQKTADTNRMT